MAENACSADLYRGLRAATLKEKDYDGTGFGARPDEHVTLAVTTVISLGLPKGNSKFCKDQYARS